MNFIKQITVSGISAITLLSTPVSANSYSLSHSQNGPDFTDTVLMGLMNSGTKLSISETTETLGGFDPTSFTIYLPKNVKQIQYCGYDEVANSIVPLELSADQVIFSALKEALDFSTGQTNDNIFEHLYDNNADVFKLLWENPYGRPEAKFSALTGLVYKNGVLETDILSGMKYDFDKFSQDVSDKTFIPRVFSVTYDRFLEIENAYPTVKFLQDINKLLTYK